LLFGQLDYVTEQFALVVAEHLLVFELIFSGAGRNVLTVITTMS